MDVISRSEIKEGDEINAPLRAILTETKSGWVIHTQNMEIVRRAPVGALFDGDYHTQAVLAIESFNKRCQILGVEPPALCLSISEASVE